MTDFVGVSPSAYVQPRDDFRIVIERDDWTLALDHLNFAASVTDFYDRMQARSGVVFPVSPNPANMAYDPVQGQTSTYAIDVRVTDNPTLVPGAPGVTAVEVVNRLNEISPRVRVARFEAISDADITDAAGRDDAAAAQKQKSDSMNPLAGLGQYVILAVVALVALALIQVSKDL